MAIYQCRQCHDLSTVPRRFRYHLGDKCRCPRCGTYRISMLRELDTIDPMNKGLFNWLEKLAGGRLFHCKFCRLQFYDRRQTPKELALRETKVANAANAANAAHVDDIIDVTEHSESVSDTKP